ncbi:hypothetical protein RB195_001382 [Necator americanus]|uniref:Reverse transcriptase domain-containing protein n=1 Tax=Necator americanus TaxID=51031 RepID=A0ABR1DE25_NECAM
MPLCLTFIDLKKAFDSVETEAVVEALDNQGVPTQYIMVLRELYNNFTTKISPFYKNVIIGVKRGVRQCDTISPKIFTATFENAMRKLQCENNVNVVNRAGSFPKSCLLALLSFIQDVFNPIKDHSCKELVNDGQ